MMRKDERRYIMIIKEYDLKCAPTSDILRKQVKEAEKELGRRITVIVGTKDELKDEAMHEMLPMVEKEIRKNHMKFAATTVLAPGAGAITLNILLAEYLHEDNACANFLIKQAKYKLTKINLVD